jgi:nitrogen fixation/metabolism regulation signal transduction histidine kinase
METLVSLEPQPRVHRRAFLIALGVFVFLLALILFSQTSLNLSFIQPESTAEAILLASISALIFLLFVALTFVLARNVIKVMAERRIGVLGSRFRARMVLVALMLSFLPTLFLFLFSYVLMNRSIEKWFSRPVEQLGQDTNKIARLLTSFAQENAAAKAKWLVEEPEVADALGSNDYGALEKAVSRHRASMQNGIVLVTSGNKVMHAFNLPNNVDPSSLLGTPETHPLFATGRAQVKPGVSLVVALPLPAEFASSLQGVEASQRGYAQLRAQQKQLRSFYMRMLMLLTVLTLFAATWLSLFIARLVTRPVAALAEATE